jgi:hypothetical protein
MFSDYYIMCICHNFINTNVPYISFFWFYHANDIGNFLHPFVIPTVLSTNIFPTTPLRHLYTYGG